MEAVVLVGGQGTRLRPLTLTTPKPMLPLAGVPFLTHQLVKARDAGVERVVLATSYRPEVFADHFGDGAALGLELDYVTETQPMGTGGGIRNVASRLTSGPDEPVLILNGDVLSGHDIAVQVRAHQMSEAAVTLHLVTVEDPRAFGCVPTDASGRVTAFLEKTPDPVTDQINAGCYIFRRSVIDAIPHDRPVSVERETFPGLLADGAVVTGYVESAYWLDVGSPAAFVAGSADVVRGVLPSAALPGEPGESLVMPGATVAHTARVVGGSVVGQHATVSAEAVIDGSVVMAGAIVGDGATVRRSVIGAGARVGPTCLIEDAVVGDDAQLGELIELRAGARVWTRTTLPDRAIRFSADT